MDDIRFRFKEKQEKETDEVKDTYGNYIYKDRTFYMGDKFYYLITSQFSGTHLLSYYLYELLNRIPLLDAIPRNRLHLNYTEESLKMNPIIQNHCFENVKHTINKNNDKIIFLCRKNHLNFLLRSLSYDFKEDIPLSHLINKIDKKKVDNLINILENYKLDTKYISSRQFLNLIDYDSYGGEKLLIFYEDLMNDTENTLNKILVFLNEKRDLDKFMENIDKYSEYISNKYQEKHYGFRRSVQNKIYNIDDYIDVKDIRNIKDLYRRINPIIFDKYLI